MVNERKPPSGDDGSSKLLANYPAGSFVFREGESGEEMYILQEGQVEVVKRYGPEEKRLSLLEAGDFFGEMAMLETRPRSASARVVADAKVLAIDASTFDQMLREYPEVAVRMLRALCQRLRRYEDEAVAANRVAQDVLAGAPRLVHVESGTEFPLPGDREVGVGRLDPVTNLSPEIDLTALDPQRSLSRRHARVASRGGRFYLREEIGTANGTFVEGARLTTGVERALEPGARVRFGRVDFVFQAG